MLALPTLAHQPGLYSGACDGTVCPVKGASALAYLIGPRTGVRLSGSCWLTRSSGYGQEVFTSDAPADSPRQPEECLSRRRAVTGLAVLALLFGSSTGAQALGASRLDTVDQSAAR